MAEVNITLNYYQILGLEPGAPVLEIKKAYFSLVRKYPPERFPDDFMNIREAYEVLSNEKTRREYDAVAGLPTFLRNNLEYARQALAEGNIGAGIGILEGLVKGFADVSFIRGLLGEAYLKNANSGKAIKIFQELIKEYPQNAGFNGHLAHAYLMRGWHIKAIDAFENALDLDEDNLSLWKGLTDALIRAERHIEARETLLEALEKGKDKDWDNAGLYFHLIHLDIVCENFPETEKHLEELTDLAIGREDIREGVGWALNQLARLMVKNGLTEMAGAMVARAARLVPGATEIEKLRQELDVLVKHREQFEKLKYNDDIHEDLVSLLELAIFPETGFVGSKLQEADLFFNELLILEGATKYLSAIKLLEKRYPDLYAVKAEFFNGVINFRKRNKMLKSYLKQASHYEMIFQMFSGWDGDDAYDDEDGYDEEDEYGKADEEDIFFDEDDEYEDENAFYDEDDDLNGAAPQQPYVREHPKIGRNDPCPCGSGKKYKKCCGR